MERDELMAFHFTEACYVEKVWFAAWEDTDWMAIVYRETADAPWSAMYRFRYYTSGVADPFADDRKSWYRLDGTKVTDDARIALIDAMDFVGEATVAARGAKLWVVNVQGNGLKAIKCLEEQPWFFSKRVSREEMDTVSPPDGLGKGNK